MFLKLYNTSVDLHHTEPFLVKEVLASHSWLQAMKDEYSTLMLNQTWCLPHLLPSATMVGCKCLFKNKYNVDGSFQRNKARSVVKGFNKIEGFDYIETFNHVVKHNTVRFVLAHAVIAQWLIRQIDMNSAFLNGDLEEIVYMQQPLGFVSKDPTLVCKLHKAIIGSNNLPRLCSRSLTTIFNNLGLLPQRVSHIYLLSSLNLILYLFLYMLMIS